MLCLTILNFMNALILVFLFDHLEVLLGRQFSRLWSLKLLVGARGIILMKYVSQLNCTEQWKQRWIVRSSWEEPGLSTSNNQPLDGLNSTYWKRQIYVLNVTLWWGTNLIILITIIVSYLESIPGTVKAFMITHCQHLNVIKSQISLTWFLNPDNLCTWNN